MSALVALHQAPQIRLHLAYATGGLWKGTVSVAAGDTCTFTETPPAVDPAMTNYCAGQNGQIAYWDPPTYGNGQTKTGNGGAQNFNFVNTWHCGPVQNGYVQIFKKVLGPSSQIPAMSFVISSNCATPSTPASVTITTSNQGGGGAVTAPVGTGCQFTEVQPATFSAAQTTYCSAQNGSVPQWAAPSYSIAQPMTVTSSLQNLFVTNDWSCVPLTTPGTIKVYKLVYGPSIPGLIVPQMPQQTYSFDSNCASPSTPTNVTITTIANGISSQPFVASVGTSCSITETLPTAWPQAITDFCTNLTPTQLPKWDAPTFSIAQPMTATTASQTVIVTNRWSCSVNGQKVKPKKRGFKLPIKINVGFGIGGGGGGDTPTQPRQGP